jgi:hypothetical protein
MAMAVQLLKGNYLTCCFYLPMCFILIKDRGRVRLFSFYAKFFCLSLRCGAVISINLTLVKEVVVQIKLVLHTRRGEEIQTKEWLARATLGRTTFSSSY